MEDRAIAAPTEEGKSRKCPEREVYRTWRMTSRSDCVDEGRYEVVLARDICRKTSIPVQQEMYRRTRRSFAPSLSQLPHPPFSTLLPFGSFRFSFPFAFRVPLSSPLKLQERKDQPSTNPRRSTRHHPYVSTKAVSHLNLHPLQLPLRPLPQFPPQLLVFRPSTLPHPLAHRQEIPTAPLLPLLLIR